MANGILIVDKPADWTSQDVTAKLRGVFRERRIGHGGTLDPMATGVLPVFVGRATRAVEFFESAEKEYVAGLRLGMTSTTQDIWGETEVHSTPDVSPEALREVLGRFTGEISQIPPMYSAVKIGGRKLYELARQGREIAREPRHITIFEMELLSGTGADFLLRVKCSKGTYVRTLCHDIGAALGCGGVLSSLRRTAAGCYRESDAIPLADILASSDPCALLRPVDSMFSAYPAQTITAAQERLCRNGADIPRWKKVGKFRVYGENGDFLMVAEGREGALHTIKSFFEVS